MDLVDEAGGLTATSPTCGCKIHGALLQENGRDTHTIAGVNDSTVPPHILTPFREAADPTRWRAYMLLGFLGPMRVGTLARMVDVSDAVMRRHLDAMAVVGLVEAVGEGRDRRWQRVLAEDRSRPAGLRVDPGDEHAEALVQSREFSEWLKVVVEVSADVVTSFVDQRMDFEASWRDATEMQDYVLYLRREQLQELGAELQEVARKRLVASRENFEANDPEARPIYVATNAVLWPHANGGRSE